MVTQVRHTSCYLRLWRRTYYSTRLTWPGNNYSNFTFSAIPEVSTQTCLMLIGNYRVNTVIQSRMYRLEFES